MFDEWAAKGQYGQPLAVVCTQPRKVAAINIANRVAAELGVEVGNEVGFQVRHDAAVSDKTRLKFMTDGLVLQQAQGDLTFKKYVISIESFA